MTKRIAILHYSSAPTVGGVETTIAHHARELANLGYAVRVICGVGGDFDSRVETFVHSTIGSRDTEVLSVKRELDKGIISNNFHLLVQQIESVLLEALKDYPVCIVHNVLTLNKNLPLTVALSRLHETQIIAWCHDLAWTNPLYLSELYDGYPWNLLRQVWKNTQYVTISEARQIELAHLLNISINDIKVVTPGIDIASFLQWTSTTYLIEDKLQLLDADMLLLLPARLTRRKNISLALHILYELKKQDDSDYRLIVSGPPGPHNPLNPGYLEELLTIRNKLGLQDTAHFLYELNDFSLVPDDQTMANLYHMSDALLFPSLQEGFGIPILEAGLVGMPIFCSDLQPFHQTGHDDVIFFHPEEDSPEAIATLIRTYFMNNPRQRLRTRVRREYRWSKIIRNQLIPLLEGT